MEGGNEGWVDFDRCGGRASLGDLYLGEVGLDVVERESGRVPGKELDEFGDEGFGPGEEAAETVGAAVLRAPVKDVVAVLEDVARVTEPGRGGEEPSAIFARGGVVGEGARAAGGEGVVVAGME